MQPTDSLKRSLPAAGQASLAVHAEVRAAPVGGELWPEERILVAVSPNPNSEHLVRWTQRMVLTLNARWTALHVDTGAPLRREDAGALQRILELARHLGAEVISIPSEDAAKAIVRYAGIVSAGKIIVGKSRSRRARLGARKTLTEQIVKHGRSIDVLVMQKKPLVAGGRPGLAGRLRGSPFFHLAVAVPVILGVTAVTTGLLTSRLKANERALGAREEKISLLYSFL